MKRLTKKECLACMQRSKSGKFCFYKEEYFQKMVEEDGDTQYWKNCDVSDKERLPKGNKSMTKEDKVNILKLAISKYGIGAQKTMAIEECSELINALVKECRGRVSDKDIVTEIADVMIMCEQLALIYGESAVESEKEYKLTRLAERMGIQ